jgi:hypothetical protein
MSTATEIESGELLGSRHHAYLGALLKQLERETYSEDGRALYFCWAVFERELERHFGEEEARLLPSFAHAYPGEARAILAEHGELRRLAEDLGTCVELHSLRAPQVARFIQRFERHVRREEALMSPWSLGDLGG